MRPGWITEAGGHRYHFIDHRFKVTVDRLSAQQCHDAGYPHCRTGYWMQFQRGGYLSGAFLETLEGAIFNAERIMGYLNGTHDVLGNPLQRETSI